MSGQNHGIDYAAWLQFVNSHVALLQSGRGDLPASSVMPAAPFALEERPLQVVLCSPHPDDEALTGGLPLRLRLEVGAKVTNLAITLGSDVTQRERRRRELESACRVLGFDLAVPQEPGGFEGIHVKKRTDQPILWAEMVQTLSEVFERLRPDVVFAPHAEDWHPAHIGTHFLAVDALAAYLARARQEAVPLIETSYWHEHAQPNLMVGLEPEIVAMLVMATAEHAGEVSRNAYHLRLPSRLIEIVRRGAETVGGAGGAAPDFPFAELYRVTFAGPRGRIEPRPGGRIVSPAGKINSSEMLGAFRP